MEKVEKMFYFLAPIFKDTPRKLKIVSKVIFTLMCLGSFIFGISIWDDWGNRWLLSILIWIVGPLFAYVQSLILYTFAQMAEDISAANQK